MFSFAYDAERLVMLLLHSGARSTEEDFEANIAALQQLERDAARKPSTKASLVVIVETDNPPDAITRKRLAEPIKNVQSIDGAFVVRSKVIYMVVTAILWFAPKSHGHSVHRTYEGARDWFVGKREHPQRLFDALHAEARSQASRGSCKIVAG